MYLRSMKQNGRYCDMLITEAFKAVRVTAPSASCDDKSVSVAIFSLSVYIIVLS